MRGAPVPSAWKLRPPRIIPADAGSTKTGVPADLLRGDHPRGCGEHAHYSMDELVRLGSSPRMRGALVVVRQIVLQPGIIPADAGSTRCQLVADLFTEDHPRGCGEHDMVTTITEDNAGSSPRMRGALLCFFVPHSLLRIIPADAGSTCGPTMLPASDQDHPRGCGEHACRAPAHRTS